MEVSHVTSSHGWLWIKRGWAMFTKSPALWLVLLLIVFCGAMLLSMIPTVGQPLATLLGPVVMAGLMSGCRALDRGEELELAHLFSGFRQFTTQLITVGGLTLLGQFLILGLMIGMGASALVGIMTSDTPPQDQQLIVDAVAGAGVAILVGIVLFSLLMMAAQFAPMLVYFNRVTPFEAMRLSLRAFFRNIGAMSVYGMICIIFAAIYVSTVIPLLGGMFLAIFGNPKISFSLTLLLGIGWLLPLVLTSLYACYSDIFPLPDETAEEIPVSQ